METYMSRTTKTTGFANLLVDEVSVFHHQRAPNMQVKNDWLDSLRRQRAESEKNWTLALILSIFLGMFGADRFYIGRTGLGILKLLTIGGYLAWWVFDIVLLLQERMKDDRGREVRRPRPGVNVV